MSAELAVATNPSPIPSPTPLAAPLPPCKKPVTVDAALLFHTTNFILSHFKAHFASVSCSSFSSSTATDSSPSKYDSNTRIPPLIVGLNGIQGAGKTTLVNALANALINDHDIKGTLVVSIDDFYLTHADQQRLAAQNPDNKLVQHRGEPGTHDIPLLRDFFAALLNCDQPSTSLNGQEVDTRTTKPNPVHVPQYDKSLHSGRGDRTPSSTWPVVNGPDQPPIQLVLFEGWCVGFRALSPAQVEAKWSGVSRTLGQHTLASLQFVNEQLRAYDAITNLFGAFVHLDAEDLTWVYDWRRQQEEALREEKGTGMTDEEVEQFVDSYYPAYELYYEGVRKGVFPEKRDAQIRMVVRRDRSLERMEVI